MQLFLRCFQTFSFFFVHGLGILASSESNFAYREEKKFSMNFGLASDNDGKSIGSQHNSQESSSAICSNILCFLLSIGQNSKIIQSP